MSGKRFPATTDRPRSRIARTRAGTRLDSGAGRGMPSSTAVRSCGEVVAGERALAVERLVQRHAEAELIGARVDGLAAQLLGRHVHRRAQDRPDAGHAPCFRSGSVWRERGQTEVHHPHARRPRATITFCGLKSRWTIPARCAAARPAPARRTRAGSRRAAAACCPARPRSVSPSISSIATNTRPLGRADVVDGDHVRMGKLGDRLRLAQQPRRLDVVGIGVAAHDLDGDLSIQLGIVRGVDLAHAAASHELEQAVAPHHRPGRCPSTELKSMMAVVGSAQAGAAAVVAAGGVGAGAGAASVGAPPPIRACLCAGRPASAPRARPGSRSRGTRAGGARPPPASPPRARRSRMQRPFARRDRPSSAGVDDSLGRWPVRKSQLWRSCFCGERPGAG